MFNPKIDLKSYFIRSKRALKERYSLSQEHISTNYKGSTNKQTESANKGYLFEQFVVSLFVSEYFTLLEWRSDKYINGIYPLTCQFPDLEYYFESQTESLHFAVECKWRKYFVRENFDWSKKEQLENYKQFEKISEIPVFMILGVGGEENNPNEVYVVPLRDIADIPLHSISLTPFQRKVPQAKLFLNCSKLILT
jgi:hypothetical protein